MSKLRLLAIFASLAMLTFFIHAAQPSSAESYRLSGPLTHDNLAVYFVHGTSRPGPIPLTLQEALTKKIVEVRETGLVNELEVTNTGDEAIYIQSGDIVKGGRQDRVLAVSMLLRPHSGAVPIPSYCVEQHRWSERPGEDAATFDSANAILPSRAAKLALRGSAAADGRPGVDSVYARQQEIWNGVTTIQGELSSSLGAQVASPRSRSSLQLALENKELSAKQTEFVDRLQTSGEAEADIIGYVVAINGHLNSAEIYPSNGLFRKMWPTLLRASATEAIKDRSGDRQPLPTTAGVALFLGGAQAAHGIDQAASASVRVNVRQSPNTMMFEARPAAAPTTGWINRSYLAK